MSLFRTFLAISIVLALSLAAFAQTGGQLSGQVQDSDGGLLAGVKVTLTNNGTGRTFSAQSSAVGEFFFPVLAAGQYTLVAEAPGFSTLEVKAIQIQVGEIRPLSLKLSVATAHQIVTVESEQVTLNTESAHLGSVIQQEQVEPLPLNGRTFAQPALLNDRAKMSAFGIESYLLAYDRYDL